MTAAALIVETGYGLEGIEKEIDGVFSAQSAHVDPIQINVHHRHQLLYLAVMEWNSQISHDVSLQQHQKFSWVVMKSNGIEDLSIVGLYLLHDHAMYISKKLIIVSLVGV